jgi:hypothetical protein
MTEAPGGKLAWGQAANYDAADDRAVITAVTRGRLGLVRPVSARAGTGLQIIVQGGWVGVASCDDLTSAVVGTRDDLVVQANPGPATGSRDDYVWADTNPDEGTFELRVITRAQAATRSGIPLVNVNVPANANTSAAMTLRSVDASIERRLMAYQPHNDSGVHTAGSWGAAVGWNRDSQEVTMEPGQWYRVRYVTNSAQLVSAPGGLRENGELRIGIGYRTAGQGPALATLAREAAINFSYVGGTTPGYQHAEVEWIFRHSISDSRFERVFSGRMWSYVNQGTLPQFRVNGSGLAGSPQMITVEDIGS